MSDIKMLINYDVLLLGANCDRPKFVHQKYVIFIVEELCRWFNMTEVHFYGILMFAGSFVVVFYVEKTSKILFLRNISNTKWKKVQLSK